MTPYQQYLLSDHWQNLRERVFRKHGRKCSICSDERRIQVHHWRYPSNWFKTTIKDLIPLCEACHQMVHRHGTHFKDKADLLKLYRDRFLHKPKKPEPKGAWMCKPLSKKEAKEQYKRARKLQKDHTLKVFCELPWVQWIFASSSNLDHFTKQIRIHMNTWKNKAFNGCIVNAYHILKSNIPHK